MASSLYDQAMTSALQGATNARKRTSQTMQEVINWIDFLDAAGSPVGSSGGGKSSGSGGLNTGGSIRNQMEGRGPSSGAIPPLMNYKWRDPIDGQVFHLTTAKGTKKYFKPFLTDLAKSGYNINDLGSYNYRNARGSNRLSEHAYGRAIDINPQQNPMGSQLITNLPSNVAKIAALHNLIWGGTWKSKKDAMHFSLTGW